MKYTTKTKNPVAKAHQTIGTGAGEHKDKKKTATQVRGQKHKKKAAEVMEMESAHAPFGSNYAEQLAKEVYDHNPNISDEDEVLNLGYNMAKGELGSRAYGIFRDEDFPSDFVSAYFWLKKNQGATESSPTPTPQWSKEQTAKRQQAKKDSAKVQMQKKKQVQDRKTGKMYDPDEEFDKLKNSPGFQAQMKRMAQKESSHVSEMDKSQKGAPGWNISDDEPRGPDRYGKAVTAKAAAKKAGKVLNKAMDQSHKKKVRESNWYEIRLATMLNEHLKK